MRRSALLCVGAALLAALAGCSRQETVDCGGDPRYSAARSAPPVQIPDDLSPPNEDDALRLPPDAVAGASAATGGCLESPPSFFGDSRPFRRSADSEEPEEREQAEQVEPAEPPPADGDRVIDN